jgi:hypothetical protein
MLTWLISLSSPVLARSESLPGLKACDMGATDDTGLGTCAVLRRRWNMGPRRLLARCTS